MRARIRGVFYNDGTAGARPGSNVGDINAAIYLSDSEVGYQIVRCLDDTCRNVAILLAGAVGTVGLGERRDLWLGWDELEERFCFQLDDRPKVAVDPTGAAPVASPVLNAPSRGSESVSTLRPVRVEE